MKKLLKSHIVFFGDLHMWLICAISHTFPGLLVLRRGKAEGPHGRLGKGDSQVALCHPLRAFHADISSSDLATSQRNHKVTPPCWRNKCAVNRLCTLVQNVQNLTCW